MKAPTKTQLMIKQELLRRGFEPAVTRQDEYLKFSDPDSSDILWIGRRGEFRVGRILCGIDRTDIYNITWQRVLKREAKENYKEENDEK